MGAGGRGESADHGCSLARLYTTTRLEGSISTTGTTKRKAIGGNELPSTHPSPDPIAQPSGGQQPTESPGPREGAVFFVPTCPSPLPSVGRRAGCDDTHLAWPCRLGRGAARRRQTARCVCDRGCGGGHRVPAQHNPHLMFTLPIESPKGGTVGSRAKEVPTTQDITTHPRDQHFTASHGHL
eukprot:87258-Prorocentrum_minimum.AAC.2